MRRGLARHGQPGRTLATAFLLLASTTAVAAAPPPGADLALEWADGGAAIEGPAGRTVVLAYRLRNIGGQRAFAALLKASTALGPVGRPARLQPGPEPGAEIARTLALPLAAAMREVCLETSLQNLRLDDPPDPTPENNRICRPVRVRAEAASPGAPAHRKGGSGG